jgi:hypothetical protein
MLKHLFNSKGQYIAIEQEGRLYTRGGKNIGHFVPEYGIYIDMRGRYLGEVMYENRLLYNRYSPFRSTAFGVWGDAGAIDTFGDPGKPGSIGIPHGYEDVEL